MDLSQKHNIMKQTKNKRALTLWFHSYNINERSKTDQWWWKSEQRLHADEESLWRISWWCFMAATCTFSLWENSLNCVAMTCALFFMCIIPHIKLQECLDLSSFFYFWVTNHMGSDETRKFSAWKLLCI